MLATSGRTSSVMPMFGRATSLTNASAAPVVPTKEYLPDRRLTCDMSSVICLFFFKFVFV